MKKIFYLGAFISCYFGEGVFGNQSSANNSSLPVLGQGGNVPENHPLAKSFTVPVAGQANITTSAIDQSGRLFNRKETNLPPSPPLPLFS